MYIAVLSSYNEYLLGYFIIHQPGLPHHTNVSPGLRHAAKDSQKAHSLVFTPISSRCKCTAHLRSQSPEGYADGGPRCDETHLTVLGAMAQGTH